MTTKAASLADRLVRDLEREIASGALPPGSRFPPERVITDRNGVSRTVVREAMARLAARGLLTTRRGSGAYVAEGAHYQAFQVTADEVREVDDILKLLEMRLALETEMADLAARRRTDEDVAALEQSLALMKSSKDVNESVAADSAFHAAIARATKNEYYWRFMDFLGVRLVPPRTLFLRDRPERDYDAYAQTIHADHQAIFDAIKAQDPTRARRAARRHMQKSIERHSQMRQAQTVPEAQPD